jgi:hypothetical protein
MIKQSDIKKVMRIISAYLVEELMKYKNITRDEALELLMQTTCYEALMDSETELYLESKEAVWDILKEELSGNPYRILVM